jgi:hypothetical protein
MSRSGLSNLTQEISAPPDQGLASQQMSGKKSSKFRITVGFLCNADGSEKWPIFFIGKSKKPHAALGKLHRNSADFTIATTKRCG